LGMEHREVVVGFQHTAQNRRRFPGAHSPLPFDISIPPLTFVHAICHWIMTAWYCGAFTIMLHNHIHNGVLSKRYAFFDFTVPCILEPLMGTRMGLITTTLNTIIARVTGPTTCSIPARLAAAPFVLHRTILLPHLDRAPSLFCAQEEVQFSCEAVRIGDRKLSIHLRDGDA